MPLTQVWSDERLDYKPERTTQEDVEHILEESVHGKVEFVPLGSWEFNNLETVFKQFLWPFTGVHPNCESFTYLIPQEEKFVSISLFVFVRARNPLQFATLCRARVHSPREIQRAIYPGILYAVAELKLSLGR